MSSLSRSVKQAGIRSLMAASSFGLALAVPSEAYAGPQVDPDCVDQSGNQVAQFNTFIPASLLGLFSVEANNDFNTPAALPFTFGGPGLVNGVLEQQVTLTGSTQLASFLGAVSNGQVQIPPTLTTTFEEPSFALPSPLNGSLFLQIEDLSIQSITFTPIPNAISATVNLTGDALITNSSGSGLLNVSLGTGTTATVQIQADPTSGQLTATLTQVSAQSNVSLTSGECALFTLESALLIFPVGCVAFNAEAQSWANSNLSSTILSKGQKALTNLFSNPSTQALILKELAAFANNLTFGSGFDAYPSSAYIDANDNLCFAGALNQSPPTSNQFGPGNPDPCNGGPRTLACAEPICNPTQMLGPGQTQFCARGWDAAPTPTCTSSWSCLNGDEATVSCSVTWPTPASPLAGDWEYVLKRSINGAAPTIAAQGPLATYTIDYTDALATTAPSLGYPANISYSMSIVPSGFEASGDHASSSATTATEALNNCACEPTWPSCQALTSFAGQQACGAVNDGCGITLECGACAAGVACIENLCGGPPKTGPIQHCPKGSTTCQ